jgi:hypothetical protein
MTILRTNFQRICTLHLINLDRLALIVFARRVGTQSPLLHQERICFACRLIKLNAAYCFVVETYHSCRGRYIVFIVLKSIQPAFPCNNVLRNFALLVAQSRRLHLRVLWRRVLMQKQYKKTFLRAQIESPQGHPR